MRTYGKENEENEVHTINNLKDDKLMWLEDALIDDALKYTGANQGTNDPEEINNVKNQVLSNLNQAYNIEKFRQENNEMQGNILQYVQFLLIKHFSIFLEKQYEKSDFILSAENNSQPMNLLDISESHKEGNILKLLNQCNYEKTRALNQVLTVILWENICNQKQK